MTTTAPLTLAPRGIMNAEYMKANCSVTGCPRFCHAKGVCQMHYLRLRRFGTLELKNGGDIATPHYPVPKYQPTWFCLHCKKSMHEGKKRSSWRKRKFCSITCHNKSRAGIKRPAFRAETIQKIRESKLGPKNPMWSGDKVGYAAIHAWVKNHKPKPSCCEDCKKPVKWLDAANLSGEYKRDISDWSYLCRRCHMIQDGRMQRLRPWKGILPKRT